MQFICYRLVPMRRLRLPGTFRVRLREPRVSALAKHIEARGLYLPILVRKKDGRVIDGFDRLAAFWLLRRDDIPAVIVDCSDEEAAMIESEVNTERRHNPDEAREKALEMVARLESDLAEEEVEKVRKANKAGRPLSRHGVARKKAAEALGITEAAVRQAEHRDRAKKGLTKATKPLNTLGMELPESMATETRAIQRLFDDAAKLVAQALGCLTTVERQEYKYPPARLQRLRQELTDIGASIRNGRPEMLCPFCKAIPAIMGGCKGCVGCGFITANQTGSVPKELLREENPLVLVGESGQFRSFWEYVNEPEQDAAGDDPFGLGGE